ncbi:MAG: ABC transporter substrate-binding protein, partial [Deltaproteobacteria bacterium]|nr:ABC transporter substrate-binding protein [Deltaproteobacteria bacterium]
MVLLCAFIIYPFCASAADSEGPVTVASKIDTEGALLGQMIVLMLRDSGFEV